MRLQLVTPPPVEPLALADAKRYLRLDIADDDTLVSGLIVAARRVCETALRQALVTQTWKLLLDSFPSAGGYYNRAIREVWPSLGGLPSGLGFYPGMIPNSTGLIDLPMPPVQAVASVQYFDCAGVLQTVPPETYTVSLGVPARLQPAYSKVWPISRPSIDSVQITFTAGYGDDPAAVPANVTTAMMMLVNHWYEHREAAIDPVISNGPVVLPLAVDALLSASDHGSYC